MKNVAAVELVVEDALGLIDEAKDNLDQACVAFTYLAGNGDDAYLDEDELREQFIRAVSIAAGAMRLLRERVANQRTEAGAAKPELQVA